MIVTDINESKFWSSSPSIKKPANVQCKTITVACRPISRDDHSTVVGNHNLLKHHNPRHLRYHQATSTRSSQAVRHRVKRRPYASIRRTGTEWSASVVSRRSAIRSSCSKWLAKATSMKISVGSWSDKGHYYGASYDSSHKQVISVIVKGEPCVVEFTDGKFKKFKKRADIPGMI